MDLTFFVSMILPILTTIALCVISYFIKGIDRRFDQVDKRFEQVDKRFEQVDKRFEQVTDQFNKRFEQVEARQNKFEDEIKQVHKDMGDLKGAIGRIDGMLSVYFSSKMQTKEQ